MAKTNPNRIRLTDDVMTLAELEYNQKYASSGMSFTVYINQKLFEILSGLAGFQTTWAAEGTTRPKTIETDLKTENSGLTGPQNEDDDLDLNELPDEI